MTQTLNDSQTRGRKWLLSNYSTLKPEDITFNGPGGFPTFTTKDGAGFLVKRIFGKTNKTVLFYPNESSMLEEGQEQYTVLLVPDRGEVRSVPARAFVENPESYDDIRLVRLDPEVQSHDGHILLHLSKRPGESSHFRINSVPMLSLLVFRDYTGHLSVSTGLNGKPDFWLALRPENYGF